jgi:hypothetical protein
MILRGFCFAEGEVVDLSDSTASSNKFSTEAAETEDPAAHSSTCRRWVDGATDGLEKFGGTDGLKALSFPDDSSLRLEPTGGAGSSSETVLV